MLSQQHNNNDLFFQTSSYWWASETDGRGVWFSYSVVDTIDADATKHTDLLIYMSSYVPKLSRQFRVICAQRTPANALVKTYSQHLDERTLDHKIQK